MLFQALTCAPVLRDGVTLNIMAIPQAGGVAPERIEVGARLTLRFGHCCPLIAEGWIISLSNDPERAVLAFDGAEWTLEHGATGVSVPGIVSEDWIVRDPAWG